MSAAALDGGEEWVAMEDASRLLGCYGIAIPDWRIAGDAAAAAAAAEELGGSVALKAQGPASSTRVRWALSGRASPVQKR